MASATWGQGRVGGVLAGQACSEGRVAAAREPFWSVGRRKSRPETLRSRLCCCNRN
jgi:hypothetical protein